MSLMPGDIVLIPYAPYTNRLAVKARPCLVISGLQFNKSGPDVILAPISSNIRIGDPKQIVIESSDISFVDTGLKQTSAVKCGAIFAYSKVQVRRKLGFVQQQILKQVRDKVIEILTGD
ncbi:MAG: type II toxin-antitoxin system PemK/MazF family toxin [bacterium]